MNETAERMNADLGVHGRCRRGGVAEIVLGSVSHEMVLDSTLAVFLIPHRLEGK
jgi:nucleotide-binding universal stress UspA family protein